MNAVPERRKNDRLSFSSMLEVRRIDSSARTKADACDLSITGMSFRTSLPLAIGDEVRIHIANVAAHASIPARVRRVDSDGGRYVVGVEHLPPSD